MRIKNNIHFLLFLFICFVHNIAVGRELIDKGDYWLHIPYSTIYCADNDTAIGSSYKIPIPKTCIDIEYSDNQYLYKLVDNQYIMIVGFSKYDLCGLKQEITSQQDLSTEDLIETLKLKYSNCVDTISLVEEVDRQTKVLHIEQCHILLFNIKESELHKIEKNFNDHFEINVNDKINQEYINLRKSRRYKTTLNDAKKNDGSLSFWGKITMGTITSLAIDKTPRSIYYRIKQQNNGTVIHPN